MFLPEPFHKFHTPTCPNAHMPTCSHVHISTGPHIHISTGPHIHTSHSSTHPNLLRFTYPHVHSMSGPHIPWSTGSLVHIYGPTHRQVHTFKSDPQVHGSNKSTGLQVLRSTRSQVHKSTGPQVLFAHVFQQAVLSTGPHVHNSSHFLK